MGDFDYFQLLDEALVVLQQTPPICPQTDTEFEGKTSMQMLDVIYHPALGLSQRNRRFLFCPDLGAAFDGLYAARIRYDSHEELLWRGFEESVVHGIILGKTEYVEVVQQLEVWLGDISRALSVHLRT